MFSAGAMSDVQPPSAPAPEPPASAPAGPEPAAATNDAAQEKPRRFGWWSRRG
jgi:hypothetical protein